MTARERDRAPGRLRRLCLSLPDAGEVIERPASVVKELLENALDAGSSRIDVEVEQGGADLVRVVDDGCGIDADDLPLAFANHATSKLQGADDLFKVGTLGLRGETLVSIGSVAQVLLQSRPPGEHLAGGTAREHPF
jgi:DNA mismatch repair protein MutL